MQVLTNINTFHFLFPDTDRQPEGFAFHFLKNKVQLNLYLLFAWNVLYSRCIYLYAFEYRLGLETLPLGPFLQLNPSQGRRGVSFILWLQFLRGCSSSGCHIVGIGMQKLRLKAGTSVSLCWQFAMPLPMPTTLPFLFLLKS